MNLLWSESTPRYPVWLALVIVSLVAFHARKQSRARALCILAVGIELTRFVADLAVWGLLALCVFERGSLAGIDGIVFTREAWENGWKAIPSHRLSIALFAVAVGIRLWRWRRGARPKPHELLSLLGTGVLIVGLYSIYIMVSHQTGSEAVRFLEGWPKSEWTQVVEPWSIRGLERTRITAMSWRGRNGAPEAVAVDESGALFRLEPWERYGTASGPSPLAIRALHLVGNGGCVTWKSGRGRCWPEHGSVPLPPLGDAPILDIQRTNTSTATRFCALFEDYTDQCWTWNWAAGEPLRRDSVAAKDVLAQSLGYDNGSGCLLYRGGRVACAIKGPATGEWGASLGFVEGVSHATKIVSGYGGGCALQADGAVMCWRGPERGDWMTGSEPPRFVAKREPPDVPMIDIDQNEERCCAVAQSGDVYCELNTLENGINYKKIPNIHDAVRVFAGPTSCAAHAGGGLSCWGYQRRYGAARKFVREKVIATHAK